MHFLFLKHTKEIVLTLGFSSTGLVRMGIYCWILGPWLMGPWIRLRLRICWRRDVGSKLIPRLFSILLTSKPSPSLPTRGNFSLTCLFSFIGAELDDIRFTQTKDAFYILSLSEPSETFVVNAKLPIMDGDSVTMIGAGNGTKLDWTFKDESLSISVPEALIAEGKYCWVFKIEYA
jgi:hypothetical protein